MVNNPITLGSSAKLPRAFFVSFSDLKLCFKSVHSQTQSNITFKEEPKMLNISEIVAKCKLRVEKSTFTDF